MRTTRLWWNLYRNSDKWWQKALLLLGLSLVVWLVIGVILPTIVALVRYTANWALAAAPMLILMVLLTYLMGKPGRSLRIGAVELLNGIVVGTFRALGVHVPDDDKGKRRRRDDDDD